jgi:hypothetical protein
MSREVPNDYDLNIAYSFGDESWAMASPVHGGGEGEQSSNNLSRVIRLLFV